MLNLVLANYSSIYWKERKLESPKKTNLCMYILIINNYSFNIRIYTYIFNIYLIKVHVIGILKACEPSISRALAFKRRLRSLETLVKVFAGVLHARVLAQTGIPADIPGNTRRTRVVLTPIRVSPGEHSGYKSKSKVHRTSRLSLLQARTNERAICLLR